MTLLVTCGGVSNTGRLTDQAARFLLVKDPERMTWIPVKNLPGDFETMARDDDAVIVLNGCTDRCATRILREHGFFDGTEMIVTDLGIKKDGLAEVRFSEIEIVAGAVITTMQEKTGAAEDDG